MNDKVEAVPIGIWPRLRGVLIPLIKLSLAGGLLWYVVATKIDDKAKASLQNIFLDQRLYMVVAISSISVQLFIGAQRLRRLLAAQGLDLKYLTVLRLSYVGAFFDTFMITSVGGDAVKAIYLARVSPVGKRLESVSVLLLDRLLGLLGLILLMLVMTLMHVRTLNQDPDIQPVLKWLYLSCFLLLLGTGMLLSGRVYESAPMRFLIKRLPFNTMLDRAYHSLQKYRLRPWVLLEGLMLSVMVHLLGVVCGYALILGMGAHPEFGPFLVAWFISTFIVSFAPMGGIGIGQLLYERIFLKIADVDQGIVLATAVQAVVILAKSPGFLAWLASREQAPEMQIEAKETT
jgi:glycosyltransferase 2 family protein